MPVIGSFIRVVAYVLPWSNLYPLFKILVALFTLRFGVAIARFILQAVRG